MSETQRRFGRFEVNLPSMVTIDGNTYTVVVSNISVGGFFAEFDDPDLAKQLMIETVVDIQISLPESTKNITSQARFTWSDNNGVGFAFERLKPIDVWSIIQLTRAPKNAFHLSVGQEPEEASDVDQELG